MRYGRRSAAHRRKLHVRRSVTRCPKVRDDVVTAVADDEPRALKMHCRCGEIVVGRRDDDRRSTVSAPGRLRFASCDRRLRFASACPAAPRSRRRGSGGHRNRPVFRHDGGLAVDRDRAEAVGSVNCDRAQALARLPSRTKTTEVVASAPDDGTREVFGRPARPGEREMCAPTPARRPRRVWPTYVPSSQTSAPLVSS